MISIEYDKKQRAALKVLLAHRDEASPIVRVSEEAGGLALYRDLGEAQVVVCVRSEVVYGDSEGNVVAIGAEALGRQVKTNATGINYNGWIESAEYLHEQDPWTASTHIGGSPLAIALQRIAKVGKEMRFSHGRQGEQRIEVVGEDWAIIATGPSDEIPAMQGQVVIPGVAAGFLALGVERFQLTDGSALIEGEAYRASAYTQVDDSPRPIPGWEPDGDQVHPWTTVFQTVNAKSVAGRTFKQAFGGTMIQLGRWDHGLALCQEIAPGWTMTGYVLSDR